MCRTSRSRGGSLLSRCETDQPAAPGAELLLSPWTIAFRASGHTATHKLGGQRGPGPSTAWRRRRRRCSNRHAHGLRQPRSRGGSRIAARSSLAGPSTRNRGTQCKAGGPVCFAVASTVLRGTAPSLNRTTLNVKGAATGKGSATGPLCPLRGFRSSGNWPSVLQPREALFVDSSFPNFKNGVLR